MFLSLISFRSPFAGD